MWTKATWPERVEEFLQSKKSKPAYSWPFPMGVFGTLREGQGNNPRMHAGKVTSHRIGFLPHFFARGLSIGYLKNSCAPFEVFSYEPDEWNKMIPGVDRFSPDRVHSHDWGYFRTLVWINLLPAGTVNERWFSKRADLGEHRDMKIDSSTWNEYEKVPCWVYSNVSSNTLLVKSEPTNPLIWPLPFGK